MIPVIEAPTEQQKPNAELLEAAMTGRLEDVQKTIKGGAKLESSDGVGTCLMRAWCCGRYFIHCLAVGGVYICILLGVLTITVLILQDGNTALIHAARKGHLVTVQYLVGIGANVEAVEKVFYTAFNIIHTACNTIMHYVYCNMFCRG